MDPYHAVEPDVESGSPTPLGYIALAFAIGLAAAVLLHSTRLDTSATAAPEDTHARCLAAQDDLQKLELGGRVSMVGDSGERIYMQDADRPAAIELAKARLVRYCP